MIWLCVSSGYPSNLIIGNSQSYVIVVLLRHVVAGLAYLRNRVYVVLKVTEVINVNTSSIPAKFNKYTWLPQCLMIVFDISPLMCHSVI